MIRSPVMLALLLAACTAQPDPVDPCGDGFARGDDGNCYQLGAEEDTAGEEPTWGSVEATCEGDGPYTLTIEAPGPIVSVWGTYNPELMELCSEYGEDWCELADAGIYGAPVDIVGASGTSAAVRCEWQNWTATLNGEEWTWSGFMLNPLQALYLLD